MPAEASPCPSCGEPVPGTLATGVPGEQYANPTAECPNCGAQLVRVVQGPADQGWRLAED